MRKLFNKYLALGIFFAFIEQAMVAISLLVIDIICKNFINNEDFILWILIYMILLTFVYIPTSLMNYFFNKARFASYSKFINDFSKDSYGKIEAIYDRNFSNHTSSYFTHEAYMIINEDIDFIKDISQLFFNVFLSVLVISKIIDKSFILAYMIALPISFIAIKLFNKKIIKHSDSFQKEKNSLMLHMYTGWPSILIGNSYNFNLWKNVFDKKVERNKNEKCSLDLSLDISAFVLVILSAIPVFICIVYSFMNLPNDLAKKTVLLATLPRQLAIIQYLSDLINILISYSDKKRRTQNLYDVLKLDKKISKGKVDFKKIRIKNKGNIYKVENLKDLEKITNGYSKGRFTIEGENGSGKSTLLSQIKKIYNDQAYLFESNSKIFFNFNSSTLQASSGQKLIYTFDEIGDILENKQIKILLLDEVNANLDYKNNEILNKKIDEIAKDVCVIEVLHYQI